MLLDFILLNVGYDLRISPGKNSTCCSCGSVTKSCLTLCNPCMKCSPYNSIFLKRSLIIPILLLSFISLHFSFKKAFLTFPFWMQHSSLLCPPLFLSLLRFMCIELVMLSKHLILCQHFLLLPSIFSSNRVFSSESVLRIRWPTYWSFSFSISPSHEYSGFTSLEITCFDFLAVQWLSRVFSRSTIWKHEFFNT